MITKSSSVERACAIKPQIGYCAEIPALPLEETEFVNMLEASGALLNPAA
jgi:hypothetical protein